MTINVNKYVFIRKLIFIGLCCCAYINSSLTYEISNTSFFRQIFPLILNSDYRDKIKNRTIEVHTLTYKNVCAYRNKKQHNGV